MLPPVVAIEVEPGPPAEAATLLVERCSEVVASAGTGGCALSSEADSEQAAWLVRVEWSGQPLHDAQIVLLHSGSAEPPVRQRELTFAERSPELDRWESVGLLAAALVVSARSEPDVQLLPAVEPEPLPAAEPDEPASPAHNSHWALGLLLTSGLQSESPQYGSNLQAQFELGSLLRPLVQLGFTHASTTPTLNSGVLAAGLGLPFVDGPLELELYLTGQAQLVHAQATRAGSSESHLITRFGGAAGIGAYPQIDSVWSIWLAAEATTLTPRVTYEVAGSDSGQLLPWGWRGMVGLRVSP